MEPAIMTWHVTKHPDSDFCSMGYHISPCEDSLRSHDEELCEGIIYSMAQEPLPFGDDIVANVDHMLNQCHGMGPDSKTMFFTKKLWIPGNFDPYESMYEDLGYNYSSSTETARWLHDPDPQMSSFVEGYGGVAAAQPALKRNTRMFVVNNHNYLATCLAEELGTEYEYFDFDYESLPHDEVFGNQFWRQTAPDTRATEERVLLKV